jgi:hypothetical protein
MRALSEVISGSPGSLVAQAAAVRHGEGDGAAEPERRKIAGEPRKAEPSLARTGRGVAGRRPERVSATGLGEPEGRGGVSLRDQRSPPARPGRSRPRQGEPEEGWRPFDRRPVKGYARRCPPLGCPAIHSKARMAKRLSSSRLFRPKLVAREAEVASTYFGSCLGRRRTGRERDETRRQKVC